MATNLAIEQSLLEEAVHVGEYKTKKDTVNQALREFIQHRKQKEILKLFGQVEYDEDYDYKKEREGI